MRVAIFHDYLNQFGGAERVLENYKGGDESNSGKVFAKIK